MNVTLTKEAAEQVRSAIAALSTENTSLAAKVASAGKPTEKSAADKAAAEQIVKLAQETADFMCSAGLVTAEHKAKTAELLTDPVKAFGYLKKAMQLYVGASKPAKEAAAQDEAPRRMGKGSAKVASETNETSKDRLAQADKAFSQRVLGH